MSLLNFVNYRSFLKSYIKEKRRTGRGEIKKISVITGIHSTFLSQVLAGSKDLSLEQGFEICKYLAFTESEKEYFLLLVQKERAGTVSLKEFITRQIEDNRIKMLSLSKRLNPDRVLSDHDRAKFYSSFIYSAVRLYCSIDNGKTLEEICERFQIERPKALEILEFLCTTQLCIQNNTHYKIGALHTHLEADSPFVLKHHSNWRLKALQSLEDRKPEELTFTTSVSISKKDFESVRENFVKTIKETLQVVKESDAEDIACITIDLFWID